MNFSNWLEVFTGFGIILFSLRFLNTILDRSISKRVKPFLNRLLANPFQCVCFGFISTLFVQASSITIITTMGLLNTSLITLEQSFLIMLGSTIGTTVKIWLFAENIRYYALILISFSSISLMIFHRPLVRDLLGTILAIGLAFFGFNMIYTALYPLSQNPEFIELLRVFDAGTLSSQLLGIVTGCILTIALQSSSTFIFLIIGLACHGLIPVPAGVAFILGANIGTTSTALIVSIEYQSEVKRLALAHFFIKTLGVAIILLLFPYYLSLVDMLIPGLPKDNIQYHIACAHTLFNIGNVVFWYFFSLFMLRFLYWVLPGEKDKNVSLPTMVRRILPSNPNLALQETERQRLKLEGLAKKLTDYCMEMLVYGSVSKKKYGISAMFGKDFDNIKEGSVELLLKISKRPLSEKQQEYIKSELKSINEYTHFYSHALIFCSFLEKGILIDHFAFPAEYHPQLESLQKLIGELWVAIFQKKSCIEHLKNIQSVLDTMQNTFFVSEMQNNNVPHEFVVWMFEALQYIYYISIHLNRLSTIFTIQNTTEITYAK